MYKTILAFVLWTSSLCVGQGVWTKAYEDEDGAVGFSGIFATQDGDFVAYGTLNTGAIENSMILVKFSLVGEVIWTKKHFDKGGLAAGIEISNGELMFVGGIYDSAFSSDPVFIKTDATGEELWYKTIDVSEGSVSALGVTELPDGTMLTCGRSSGQLNVMSISANGDVIWNNTYENGRGYDIVPAWDGGGW